MTGHAPGHPPIDVAALARWLDSVRIGSGPIHDLAPLAGGTQNMILRFGRAGQRFVLRGPPRQAGAAGDTTMQRETRVLRALAGTGVPHPCLFAVCTDHSVLGTAFYVMEAVDGFNATLGLPAPHAASASMRRRMGFALIDGLCALGRIDAAALGLGDLGNPDGFLERQVTRWATQLTRYGEHAGWPGAACLPSLDHIARWLDRHRPPSFTPGLLHGDYHLANVMFRTDGPDLAAIVDWELTTFGDPLVDLGWVLATWPDASGPKPGDVGATPWHGFPDAAALVAHYASQTDRDLSHLRWYAVFACYKLGIILEGTHARSCAGKADPETGSKLHAQAVALLRRGRDWTDSKGALSHLD